MAARIKQRAVIIKKKYLAKHISAKVWNWLFHAIGLDKLRFGADIWQKALFQKGTAKLLNNAQAFWARIRMGADKFTSGKYCVAMSNWLPATIEIQTYLALKGKLGQDGCSGLAELAKSRRATKIAKEKELQRPWEQGTCCWLSSRNQDVKHAHVTFFTD